MIPWDVQLIQSLLLGCDVGNNEDDSLILWWQQCCGGARYNPKSKEWIVSANDIQNDPMDLATEALCHVKEKDEVLPALQKLLHELVERRGGPVDC